MASVSVIIPSYNSARYLGQAIDSVCAQTFDDIEVIVVDDGSTDDTRDVACALAAADPRVRYIHQANRGLAGARNSGIRASCGRYLAFLDADDLFRPRKIEFQVAAMEARRDLGLTAGGHSFIDRVGRVHYDSRPWCQSPRLDFETLLMGIPFIVSSALVRRTWVESVGLFDERLRRLEDWDFWLRLARADCPMVWVEAIVSCYRIHGDQMVGDPVAQKSGMLAVLDKLYAADDGCSALAHDRRDRAYASVHLRGACREYGGGAISEARQDLARAVNLDPTLLDGEPSRLFETLVGWVAEPVVGDPFRYLASVFDNLPYEAATLRPLRNKAMALGAASLLFNGHQRGDWRLVRRALALAVYHDPSWLANRGVLSIAAQGFLGIMRAPTDLHTGLRQ